jgi:hypothetical protein
MYYYILGPVISGYEVRRYFVCLSVVGHGISATILVVTEDRAGYDGNDGLRIKDVFSALWLF